MKTKIFLTTIVIAICLGCIALPLVGVEQTTKAANAESEIQRLRKQVAELQARVRELENRLEKYEKSARQRTPPKLYEFRQFGVLTNLPPLHLPLPALPFGQRQWPKIWGGGTINGWPYYFIPCDQE